MGANYGSLFSCFQKALVFVGGGAADVAGPCHSCGQDSGEASLTEATDRIPGRDAVCIFLLYAI